jgi:hypothetical protein
MNTKNIFKILISNFYLISLTCFFSAAWIGQSFYYIPIADDFAFRKMFEHGLWNTVWDWYGKTGIRRSFGFWSNAPICASPEWLTNSILILLNYISTILVFFVTLKITRVNSISYLAALIAGVFPFGYGAITWACGSYTITISILFLAGLLFLLHYGAGGIQAQWVAIILSSICFFLCCICGEHYVFAIALTGVLALSTTDEGVTLRGLFRPWVLAPAAVTALYIVLVIFTKSSPGLMDSEWRESSLRNSFNPRTLLSVWFYQWQHLLMLEPWMSLQSLSYTINDLGIIRITFGLVLVIVGCLYLMKSRLQPVDCLQKMCNKLIWKSDVAVLILMMFCIAFVHALAGGYSASSRHQYGPLVVFSILLATLAVRVRFFKKILMRKNSIVLIILSLIAVGTTWLVTAANRHELRTYDALCNFLAKNNVSYPISVQYSPTLYHLWASQKKIVCPPFDEGWAINLGVAIGRNGSKVEISEKATTKILVERNGEATVISIVD